MATEMVAAWLLTLALHASVLIGIAWLLDRVWVRTRPAWREVLWRVALFGGFATAGAQVMFDAPAPLRIALAARETSSANRLVSVPTTAHDALPRTNASASRASENEDAGATSVTESRTQSVSPAQVASTSLPSRVASSLPPWHLVLIAGWLAGMLIALARLAAGWFRLRRDLDRSEAIADTRLATDVAALAIQARIEAPRLAALDDLASPVAARGRCIVLPRWAVDLLDREQLRAMLAHETAHIARRDPEWKLLVAVWSAFLWFVPLVPLARRRLDEIAEISCDAWAAIHLGDGRSLAECLAECAERRLGGIDTGLVPAMAGRESPLLQRIDYLIAGVPMNIESAGARAGLAAVVALVLGAFALPGISFDAAAARAAPPPPPSPPSAPAAPSAPAVPDAPAKDGVGRHIHVSDTSIGGHDLMIVQIGDDQHRYNARIDGKISFTEDENDIASLSDGGTASFTETRDGRTRRLDIASRGGRLERRYFVDDKEQPAGAETRAWMAELIPTVVRETALGAEDRVRRLRAKGGADAVLDEIGRIESGYARGVYIRDLAAGGKLGTAEMTRALGLVDGIDSAYEKRNALAALMAVQSLDAGQQKLVLAQADKIDSDYDRAQLLIDTLPQLAAAEDVRSAWLKAASRIDSAYERRRVLTALLDTKSVDEPTLKAVVDAARTIDSAYDQRELLTATAQRTHDADSIATDYGNAAARISSSYDRREALIALTRAHGFGKAGAGAVLDASAGIDSDYDCREVLVALALVMPKDAALIQRYRDVARHLSDSDRVEAERALDRFSS